MERRALLHAALAAIPLRAFGLPAEPGGSPTRPVFVRAGRARFDAPYALGVGHMECKVSARDTGGALAVFEARTFKADRPVKHFHRAQDEWFYVLEGRYEMHVGDETFQMAPGDSVLAPRLVPHVWACVSEEPGRIMAALQPAGTIEAFFRELPKYVARNASPEEFQALNRAHGMEVVGPRLPMG